MGPKNTNGQNSKSRSSNERYEKTWKYDGNFANVAAFTREVIQDIECETSLGVAILKGAISIRIRNSLIGNIVSQVDPIMGDIELVKYITSEMSDSDIAKLAKSQGDIVVGVALQTMIQRIKTETNENESDKIQDIMDAVIAKSRTTWKTNESEETNDDNKILYKPKGETKVLNRQDYIKIIKKSENDKKQEERQEKGLFTREEFIDNGIIAELSDEEETEFETSGFIPAKYLVKANKLITKYVMKRITKRLIQQDSRLTKTDGSTKNGIEIYNILRKPKSTNIKNIIYLTNRIQQVKTWKNIDYHKYAKELFKLETQRHEAIEAMNCTLPPHHI
eukprot:g3163.t1